MVKKRCSRKLLLLITIAIVTLVLVPAIFKSEGVAQTESGAGYATIYVSPASVDLEIPPYKLGDTFNVQVRIKNYTHVAAWQVKVAYNKSMLNASKCDLVAPSDFIFPPGTYTSVSAALGSGSVNGTHDYRMMSAATLGAVEYNKTVKPDAGLMNITFTIMSVPPKGSTLSSFFELYAPEPPAVSGDTWTIDTNVNDNALTTTGGSYRISASVSDGGGNGGGGGSGGAFPFEIVAAVVIVVVAAAAVGVLLLRRRKKSA